jgi:hypothetical protein
VMLTQSQIRKIKSQKLEIPPKIRRKPCLSQGYQAIRHALHPRKI